MEKYHKIESVYKRDPETKFRTFLEGEFSLPEFEYLKDNVWVFTEKVDGTNIRIMWDGSSITFGGKTDKAQIPPLLFDTLHETFDSISVFQSLFGSAEVCLYGEGYGFKINKGEKYRKDNAFVLFDVKVGRWWLERSSVEELAKGLGVETVPIVGEGNIETMVELVRKGFISAWGNFTAEGAVARPKVELFCRNGRRIIAKVKHKDFAEE